MDIFFDKLNIHDGNFTLYFPIKEPSRIQTSTGDPHARNIWIYEIDDRDKIIFSDGYYTGGQKFWSNDIKEFLIDCRKTKENYKYNFAAEDHLSKSKNKVTITTEEKIKQYDACISYFLDTNEHGSEMIVPLIKKYGVSKEFLEDVFSWNQETIEECLEKDKKQEEVMEME